MTIRKKLEGMIIDNGLFKAEATEVMEIFEKSAAGQEMKGRLDEDESAYPPSLITTLWFPVSKAAVEWIDANKPQHWARAIFAD